MRLLVELFLTLFLFSSCDSVPFLSSNEEEGPVQYELELNSEQISQLSHLEATFTVTNVSDEDQNFSFSSGCQYGFTVSKDKSIIFDSRDHIMCSQALTSFTLKPNDSKNFDIELSNAGDLEPLEQGTYRLNAFLLDDQSPAVTQSFTIN